MTRYDTVDAIPAEVRRSLPLNAQETWRRAYNKALADGAGDDEAASGIAWLATHAKHDFGPRGGVKKSLRNDDEPNSDNVLTDEPGDANPCTGKENASADYPTAIGENGDGGRHLTPPAPHPGAGRGENGREQVSGTAGDGGTAERVSEGMAVTKKEGDAGEFASSAYAYVPDAEKPSTWKLRLEEEPGKVTARMLGDAAAAFSEGGFRGNRVELPEDAIAGAKAKIRAAYKALGTEAKDMPESVNEAYLSLGGFDVSPVAPVKPPVPSTDFATNLGRRAERGGTSLGDVNLYKHTDALRETLGAIQSSKSTTKHDDAKQAIADFGDCLGEHLGKARIEEAARTAVAGTGFESSIASPPSPLSQNSPTPLRGARELLKEGGNGGAARGGKVERVEEFFPATSIETLPDGDYKVEFLCHGLTGDGRRYYPKAVTEAAAAEGVFDGAKMYFNHSDNRADKARGHRDVREWAATIKPGTVRAVEGNLQATIHAHKADAREILDDPLAKQSVGLSHDSFVKMSKGRINGKEVGIVEAIQQCNSVDLVPEGNARGRVLEAAPHPAEEVLSMAVTDISVEDLIETIEARPEIMDALAQRIAEVGKSRTVTPAAPVAPAAPVEDPRVAEALSEAKAAKDEAAKLRQESMVRDTAELVRESVAGETGLSEISRTRVIEGFAGQIVPATEIVTKVKEACDKEKAYALQLLREAGVRTRVTGANSEPDPASVQAREARSNDLKARLKADGASDAQIESMMKAR